ncbi:hypothetical protein ACOSP7_013218 [Xanthoceras sorbifolium]
MDSDKIATLCESLSLSDDDGPVLQFGGDKQKEGIRDVNNCLVGNVLSRKRVNRDAFKAIIIQIWGTMGFVEVEAVGDNVFVFVFRKFEDLTMLAEMVEEVVECPGDTRECWGRFFRVKVRVDIFKPLKRGLRVWLEEFSTMIIAPIKYERLPEFCYVCGLVSHCWRECPSEAERSKVLGGSPAKFGA